MRCLAPLLLAATISLATQVEGAEMTVRRHGDGLVVVATDVPIEDVLAEISRVTGISVTFEASAASPRELVTTSFAAASAEEALRRVLRHDNFLLVYSRERLEAVRIYPAPTAPVAGGRGADRDALRAVALGDPDPAARKGALMQLPVSNDDEVARETAVQVLEWETDAGVLSAALDVLSTQESVPVDRLMRFVNRAAPGIVRSEAIVMLVENSGATGPLLDLLRARARDPDADVREIAAAFLEALEAR